MLLTIYRNYTEHLTQNIAADNVATFTRSLMAEHKVTCQFKSAVPLDLKKGDFIIIDGVRFTINLTPEVERTNIFTYNCTFESPLYNSYSKVFMDEGDAEFDYNAATPLQMIQLWVENMNSLDPGWTIGQVDSAPVQNFTFSNVKCREALNTIATQFGLEYWVNNKEIHLIKKAGFDTSLRFQYGQGNGLYQLTRKNIDDKNIVTKLYAFGSDKNLDYTYGSKRLKLSSPLTQNTDLYGIEEGVVNFDDIYPHRESKVTAVGADSLSITDSTLDFDINDYLISGTAAKISFLDGDFAGVTFEINKYDAATNTIYFNVYTDDTGYTYPNDLRTARIGDTYTLIDIIMPQSYVAAAEAELKTRAEEYLAENSVPRVAYGLQIDPINARKKAIHFGIGDRVQIVDTKLGVDAKIRVTAISYPLYDPYQITATIADKVEPTLVQRLIAKDAENSTQIGIVDRTQAENGRINAARWKELQKLVFDPDGYFDPTKIKPESIETLMLTVGAKSGNFDLSGVLFDLNNGGDPNKIVISAGDLIHYTLQIQGLGYIWHLNSKTFTDLISSKPYYMYAKCSKTALTGTWEISENQIKVDAEAGYYWLSIGVIYAIDETGYRGKGFTYGESSLIGDRLKVGEISDQSGIDKWNLTERKLNVGDPGGNGFDYNISIPNDFVFRGGVVQRSPGITAPIGAWRGAYDTTPGVPYFPGDQVTYNGQTYTYIAETSSSGHLPTDTNYWEISAAKGEKGDTGSQGPQGIKGDQGIPGTSSYFHVRYSANANGNPMSTVPNKYIGTVVTNSPTAPTSYTAYIWTQFEGSQGPDGQQGIPGTNGENGETSYLHIKYSNDNGETFTGNGGEDDGDYLGQYVDFTQADSTNPLDYHWSKIKGDKGDQGDPGPQGIQGLQGEKGDQGIAGTPGADGQTSYFHTAYADTSTGGGFSQSPTNKKYIGTYVDFTPTDSTDPADYSWMLTQGLKGDQGIPGTNGADGQTSYLHIAYANNATGTSGFSTTDGTGKLYIGQYTDFTAADSTDPTKYTWTLIKGEKGDQGPQGERGLQGEKGDQGIQGPKGDDGLSTYFHIAYANNSTGTSGFSTSDPTGRTYIGTYVDNSPTDSTDPSKYAWMLSKGIQGDQGIPGTDGADGQTSYLHIAYANNSTGTSGFSTTDGTNKSYIGQYVDFIATDSTDPTKYTWTLWKGATGPKGDTGDTGSQGNYVEHRFAKNGSPTSAPTLATTSANPAGWTTSQPAVGLLEYLWMTTATKTAAGALVTNWSTPTRLTGEKGNNGPSLIPRGLWSDTAQYQGSAAGIDVVKYTDNIWYFARVDAGPIPVGTLPTNTAYWNEFGANFESVATSVFFAEKGTINNLLVQTLETVLQAHTDPEDDTSPMINVSHIVIDGSKQNPFILYNKDGNQVLVMNVLEGRFEGYDSNNNPVYSGGGAGLRVNSPANDGTGLAELSSSGVFINGSNQKIYGTPGPLPDSNAGIVSHLRKRVTTDLPEAFGYAVSAAVAGIDFTTDADGNSHSYGGYFNTLFAGLIYGGRFAAKRITGNYTLTERDLLITVASGGNTIFLPADPQLGQLYVIKNAGFANVVLNDNSSSNLIIANSTVPQGSLNLWAGTNYYDMTFVWFDGTYWVANRFVTD